MAYASRENTDTSYTKKDHTIDIIYLRWDFTDDDDSEGGAEHGDEAGGKLLEDDGEDGIDEDVGEEDRAEQVVAMVAHRRYRPRVLFLLWTNQRHWNITV